MIPMSVMASGHVEINTIHIYLNVLPYRYTFHYLNEKGIESILTNLFRCISNPVLGKTRNKKHRKSEFLIALIAVSCLLLPLLRQRRKDRLAPDKANDPRQNDP